MATVRREVSDRTFFGKLVKWVFVGFNVLMLIWIIGGGSAASQKVASLSTNAEKAGYSLGTAIGIGALLMLWVMGDVIIGLLVLLTRRKKIIEVEE